MNELTLGIIIGCAVSSIVAIILMLKSVLTDIAAIKGHLVTIITMLLKIDKNTQMTLAASEGFMEGLRQSMEQMNVMSGAEPSMRNPRDQFRDLRNKFQEGINRLEDDTDDDDEDENDGPSGPPEEWKKK